MITCPKCSKDNQDHYKFCLGCGAELPRDASPKPFTPDAGSSAKVAAVSSAASAPAPAPVVPPSVVAPSVVAPSAVAPTSNVAPSAAPSAAQIACPQCGHVNQPSNLFCGSCGFRLGGAGAVSAKPATQAQPSVGGGSTLHLTALRADGSEAGTYTLPPGTVTVGRETGSIFAGDSYLSPRHATFKQTSAKVTVKDEASLNGVYKKLVRDVPVELRPNDMFRIGQEIIKFESLQKETPGADGVERLGSPSKGYVGRIALVIGRDVTGNAFPIPETGVHLGRERGDVLFPEDGYVSGLHCRLSWEGGRLMLTDLGSSNGSFLRLREETDIKSGDVLLMGQQLFRVAV
ncbi:MAG: FHA domain-containing protein [Labilithrix sp.]